MNRSLIISIIGFVILILIIAVILGSLSFPSMKNQTTTSVVSTSRTTVGLVSKNTSFNASCISTCSSSLHLLTFDQTPLCPTYTSLFNATFIPWSVTLSNDKTSTTEVEPAGTPLPLNGSVSGGPGLTQYTQISFSIKNGNYNYTLSPYGIRNNRSQDSGTVTVNGSDVIIDLAYYPMSCGASTLQTIRTNLTIYYSPACLVRETFSQSCPTINTVDQSPSMSNVSLLYYRYTTFYYSVDFTLYSNNMPTTYNVWFTNSSIFCITPKYENYRVCPLS